MITVRLTDQALNAFEEYRGNMISVLDSLPAK
jgi:hypothetical protein